MYNPDIALFGVPPTRLVGPCRQVLQQEERKGTGKLYLLLTFPDEKHSQEEERFISIGRSSKGKTLIVVHTERNGSICIISSRSATPSERNIFEEGGF